MVEEYEEIAESQYLSERLEYLDEDYGRTLIGRPAFFFDQGKLAEGLLCHELFFK